MRPVILVPWRGGEVRRERNRRTATRYLRAYGWDIYEGDSEGPWSRGRAVNAAARAAGEWDVALIADADTIGDPTVVARAANRALRTGGAYRPHNRLWMLNPAQSADLASFGPESLILTAKTTTHPGGGLLVVSRSAWDAVGGYDDRFVEWGHEDSDLNTRLLAAADWDVLVGDAYHLWHPRDTTKTPNVLANRDRMRRTQVANREAIRRASEERGWDVGAHL